MDKEDLLRELNAARPLNLFSLYTAQQAEYLALVGTEISELSSSWGDGALIDGEELVRCTGLFWLWVLGAYEVLRTMDQNAECFATGLQQRIKAEKQIIAQIRMPFAKQELNRRGGPVYAELSVTGFEKGPYYDIGGERFRLPEVIGRFLDLMNSIGPENILQEIPARRTTD
ncbi:hypothetical protein [Mangrovicoccus sp. HB161399]|uniref:hypothetical protein n=1 Tax=Mangrovicoccus sp. HB161399 TaxID=2720392 RepID=UPI001557403D|nr:hypothetical protein [Mangrovicoccus sp. HB161399]